MTSKVTIEKDALRNDYSIFIERKGKSDGYLSTQDWLTLTLPELKQIVKLAEKIIKKKR